MLVKCISKFNIAMNTEFIISSQRTTMEYNIFLVRIIFWVIFFYVCALTKNTKLLKDCIRHIIICACTKYVLATTISDEIIILNDFFLSFG